MFSGSDWRGTETLDKESAIYAEHVLDLFAEVLHKVNTVQPLKSIGGDVTPAPVQGLQFLLRHEACSVRDVARGLSTTYSAASQLTDRLVRKGLATRCENERDRRLSEICLTCEGRNLVEQVRALRLQGMSSILDRMDQTHRKALLENLKSFITVAIDGEQTALETCSHCGKEHQAECVVNEAYIAATGMQIEKV
jgi:DNA-binding MarR family transcriptional regulator